LEFISIKMGKSIKECGKTIYKMVKVYKNFWMNGNIKEILLTE